MSAIKKLSGSKKRQSKRNQLIKEVASRPGQLKISNIFVKSIETVCELKSNDSSSSFYGKGYTEKVQGKDSDVNINIPTNVGSVSNTSDNFNAVELQKTIDAWTDPRADKVQTSTGNDKGESNSSTMECEGCTERMLVGESVDVDYTTGPNDIPSHSNEAEPQYVDRIDLIALEEPSNDDGARCETSNELACIAAVQNDLIDLAADKENARPSNSSTLVSLNKLSIDWFLRNYDCLSLTKERKNGKVRPILHCNVCKEFENLAKVTSKNGSNYMANGVKVDSQEKLQRVLHHVNGKSHNDCLLAKHNHELWMNQSEEHIWRKYLQVQHRDLVEHLMRMAIDVYNDSLHDTLPAWNWASRSLAHHKGNQLVKRVKDEVQEMVNDVCESWHALSYLPNVDTSDEGCRYSLRLRQMFVKSKGRFKWLLGVFMVAAPHNMGTERVVSHYNQIKTIHRENTSEETMTKRLVIAMNGVGTANYDPRPAVIRFLQAKDRRFRSSDFEIYQNRDFVKTFFRTESSI